MAKNREIICAICGKHFFSTASNSPKYCSASCKVAGEELNRKKWQAKNADYMRKYMRNYRQAFRDQDGSQK